MGSAWNCTGPCNIYPRSVSSDLASVSYTIIFQYEKQVFLFRAWENVDPFVPEVTFTGPDPFHSQKTSIERNMSPKYFSIFQLESIKGSIFLKNRHFIIQERFNKLIYCINTIIKWGTWQPVKFQLVSCSWNGMIFHRISELMLPTLIQRHNKKSFHFWSRSKTRD